VPKDKDIEFNVKKRSSTLPFSPLTRSDVITSTKDVGEYLSVAFCSSNGEWGQKLADYTCKTYMDELQDVLDNSERAVLSIANI